MRVSRTAVLLLIAGSIATLAGCARPAPPFNVDNARAHVEQLAGRIGSRPAGTDANRRAREYLIDQLQLYGFSVRVQDAEGARPDLGLTGRVHNLIAFKPGTRPEAVGLVAHYDSVPDGPGAGDDAIGVGVVLEAARVLGRRPRLWSLAVLLTDAEEHGLLGAAAAVTDEEILRRLEACVNVEAVGTAEPAVLFESGPGNAWMLQAWARSAPRPRGASYFNEIYQRLPNDTDFTLLGQAGIPGLNLAAVGNSYAYHTPLDGPERVTNRVLANLGTSVVAWVEALDERDITLRGPDPAVFFDVGGLRAWAWSQPAWRLVDLAALVAALLGGIRLLLVAARRVRLPGLLLVVLWTVAGALAVVGTSVGVVALLRAIREVYHPWYAHPWRTFLLVGLSGAAAGWVLFRLAARLPERVRLKREPDLFWLPALAVWTALAALAVARVPAAAYLFTLPAGAAGVVAGLTAGHRRRLAAGSWLVAAIAGALWLPNLADVMPFFVPVLGRLPLVTPIYLPPALVLLPALMVAPPVVAALAGSGWRRPRFLTRAVLTAAVFSLGWAYLADAYTQERPERRFLRYTADLGVGRAYWEIGGNEPGLGIGPGAPSGWRPAGGLHPAGPPVAALRTPFTFIAPAAVAPPPVSAWRRATVGEEAVRLEVEVRPTSPGLRVMLVLPAGIVPLDSNYPGRVRDGHWVAAYAAAPVEGVIFEVTLPHEAEARFADVRAAVQGPVPGAATASGSPAWTPEGRATWSSRATFLVPVPEAPPAPPGALPAPLAREGAEALRYSP